MGDLLISPTISTLPHQRQGVAGDERNALLAKGIPRPHGPEREVALRSRQRHGRSSGLQAATSAAGSLSPGPERFNHDARRIFNGVGSVLLLIRRVLILVGRIFLHVERIDNVAGIHPDDGDNLGDPGRHFELVWEFQQRGGWIVIQPGGWQFFVLRIGESNPGSIHRGRRSHQPQTIHPHMEQTHALR